MNLVTFLILAPPILLALVFHEFSHAFVAHKLGDNTAKQNGRLTLNPLAHLDPLGTLMIFLVRFGWAKPVPVNPYNLKNPKRDMLWISVAGPLSNMILAFLSGTLLRLIYHTGIKPEITSIGGLLMLMLVFSLQINLALAIFNILPIAPLDGSKILYGVLPNKYSGFALLLEKYGPMVLLGLIAIGYIANIHILGGLIWPFVRFFSKLFAGI
ncbi:site-2 protease family protein [candidate division KSB1 bacterium]|nr:site-2 protease family protein [candidate division KSB1 bacterium]